MGLHNVVSRRGVMAVWDQVMLAWVPFGLSGIVQLGFEAVDLYQWPDSHG